jgi:hypothetical protein
MIINYNAIPVLLAVVVVSLLLISFWLSPNDPQAANCRLVVEAATSEFDSGGETISERKPVKEVRLELSRSVGTGDGVKTEALCYYREARGSDAEAGGFAEHPERVVIDGEALGKDELREIVSKLP